MSKLKDAFQNLLSKAKPQQNQQASAQPGKDGKTAQSKSQGSKQQNGKDGQPQKGQQGDAQEGEDGQEAKNSENAQQGKGQGKSDSQQSSKQPGSGIGSQDGDKGIKNAEQLAAMGKLSEILGKRSATISGEATKSRWRCSLTCSNTSSRCASSPRRPRRSSGRRVRAAQRRPPHFHFLEGTTRVSKSNKCCGLNAFFDHLNEGSNSTPTKYPISR
jgi:hypothetical protein